ncbi:TPA: hypothetical protein DCW61_02620 [Candidatus Uhrbacteria bacterium]|nr:hypothetical protein [Candidatus Uhrbacteria bacterium]
MIKSFLRKIIPESLINVYHFVLAHFAAFFYGYPSQQLIVIGVTGTNGKSTTVQFIGRLLEHTGQRVGWTSTASFKVADHEWVNDKKMTMLGRFQTQKLLKKMVEAGCGYAIIETSSQGIAQFRHIGINYDIAVFTNLTPEHIEAHGGFEHYKTAKGTFFASLKKTGRKKIDGKEREKTIIVNLDDVHADYFLSFEADRFTGFSTRKIQRSLSRLNTTPLIAKEVQFSGVCTLFTYDDLLFHFKPVGPFYLSNLLAAMTVVRELGVSTDVLRLAVESLEPVAGRLENIDEGQPFIVIVDYAYEPAALLALYQAIALIAHDRIIHLLGSAGGGRDVARRQVLGSMAAQHDDIVIVTNEDPYDESPMQIIDDVADQAKQEGKKDEIDLFRILDREQAIEFAMGLAQPKDLILITGKGSEPVMAVAHGRKIPWDDRLVVRKVLQKRYGST